MAGHERHLSQIGDVPGRDDDPARVRVRLDLSDDFAYLINVFPVGRRPRPPLNPVNRTQFAVLIGPLVPDADIVLV